MIYEIALYAGLIILAVGLVHRIDAWFLREVGTRRGDPAPAQRWLAGLRGILGAVFSLRIFKLLKVLVVDVLVQARILGDRKDPLAWPAHIGIFVGFVFLLLFHALADTFAHLIQPFYQSTLNPFMFLRNLFGALLLTGLVLALVRRIVMRRRLRTTARDALALGILAAITLSGFLLEGLKITSYAEFRAMAADYAGALAPADLQALRAYWIEHYGLAAPMPAAVTDPERGRALHESSCAMCHSRPNAAFVSYPVSRALYPAAPRLDEAGMVKVLWYVHVLCCCFGLAYLAFGKMFHMFATPVSLVVAELARKEQDPAAAANRQSIELDGCRHGGLCHENCRVRRRRLERIGTTAAYDPMLSFIGTKSARDLGSRMIAN